MNNDKIIFKGTTQKNRSARAVIIVGAVLILISFIEAYYGYSTHDYLRSWYPGVGGFIEFFIENLFFSHCYYCGWVLSAGVIALVVGIIIMFNTEKCEITVTGSGIVGKLPHGKNADIPLNQVIAINPCSFNGISISSIGNVSNFHCIENRDEVIKAISYLLANPQPAATSASDNEAEQLQRLKDVLDAGIITQEEFDAKKKQILGL